MKPIVFIALAAILGSIAVDGYGVINHYKRRGPQRHHRPPGPHWPHGHHDPSGHNGENGPLAPNDSPRLDRWTSPHASHHEPPHQRIASKKEFNRSAWFGSPESRESDSGPYSDPDSRPDSGSDSGPDSREDIGPDSKEDSGPDSREESGPDSREASGPDSGLDGESNSRQDSRLQGGWHSGPDDNDSSYDSLSDENRRDSGRRPPCRRWRCSPKPTRAPWTKRPFQTKPTTSKSTRPWTSRPTTKAWWQTSPSPGRFTTLPGTTGWWETTTPWSTKGPNTSGWHTQRPTRESRSTDTPFLTPKPTQSVSSPKTISTGGTTHVDATTSSPDTNTNTDSTPEMTTISEAVFDCIDNCLTTPEYNPVCGTDGLTYDNIGKLLCTKNCGLNVDLRRRSVCPPPVFFPDDAETTPGGSGGEGRGRGDGNGGTTPPPMTTNPPIVGRTTSLSSIQRCMKQCPVTPDFSPVCGTDLVTYININRLNCAKGCGEDVQVLCMKPCGLCNQGTQTTVFSTTNTPRPNVQTTPQTTGTSSIGRTTPTPTMEQCIKSCPVTSEYNPVCGTNDVTYANAGHLLCAQMCGDGVKVARMSPCSMGLTPGFSMTTTSSSITTTEDYDYYVDTTLAPDVLTCIRRCPVTSEYNPVCGTNGFTYSSPGRLECAKYCGVNVELRHKRTCFDPPDTTISSSSTTGASIAGNKDVTHTQSWTTPGTSSGTSSSTSTSSQTPYTSPTTIGSTSSLDFTIPTDILSSIFGDNTTASSTQPTKSPSVDDDDFDIDPRFGNDTEERNYRNEFAQEGRIIFPE